MTAGINNIVRSQLVKVNNAYNEQNRQLDSIGHIELENPMKLGATRIFTLTSPTYSINFPCFTKGTKQRDCRVYPVNDRVYTGWAQLIRSYSLAIFCFELSGIRINSKYLTWNDCNVVNNFWKLCIKWQLRINYVRINRTQPVVVKTSAMILCLSFRLSTTWNFQENKQVKYSTQLT